MNIFLVEDDLALAKALTQSLQSSGFVITHAQSIQEAKTKFKPEIHRLVLLDWMLPDGQGIDLLSRWRKEKHSTPVIFLTARADVIDKVLGLELGANDYVTKPFDPRELIARIRVLLREPAQKLDQNSGKIPSPELKCGKIRLITHTREVFLSEEKIELAKMEFDLLRFLMESPNRVFSREELLNKVWGYDQYPTTRTIDTHILQLRQKLGEAYFETVRGIGYRFKYE